MYIVENNELWIALVYMIPCVRYQIQLQLNITVNARGLPSTSLEKRNIFVNFREEINSVSIDITMYPKTATQSNQMTNHAREKVFHHS